MTLKSLRSKRQRPTNQIRTGDLRITSKFPVLITKTENCDIIQVFIFGIWCIHVRHGQKFDKHSSSTNPKVRLCVTLVCYSDFSLTVERAGQSKLLYIRGNLNPSSCMSKIFVKVSEIQNVILQCAPGVNLSVYSSCHSKCSKKSSHQQNLNARYVYINRIKLKV